MACMTVSLSAARTCPLSGFGACPVRLDVPLLDDYLIFLAAGACPPPLRMSTKTTFTAGIRDG
jgi:hypothetical protein